MNVDPINPAHYAGTLCAEIGERLTANSYQVLKYNWRLGKKDAPVIELGKSIWYLRREIELSYAGWRPPSAVALPADTWFYPRLEGQTVYVRAIAWSLINWNRYADPDQLIVLLDTLVEREKGMKE